MKIFLLTPSILEQARRGVQNLEKEFSKNHNDMSALKQKIQTELNYSKNSQGDLRNIKDKNLLIENKANGEE